MMKKTLSFLAVTVITLTIGCVATGCLSLSEQEQFKLLKLD